MAEDVSRAVGAASPEPIMIAGKEFKPRALSLKELGEVERDCLKRYRRQYLESYSENLDLVSPAKRDQIMEQKIEEISRWDLTDLPARYAVDWRKVKLTDKSRAWVENYLEANQATDAKPTDATHVDRFYKKIIGAMVDQGVLSDTEYRELTGYDSPKVKVPYVSWWTTGSMEGQITMLWMCASPSGITRAEVESDPLVLQNPQRLLQLVQEIEALTAPSLGNGQGSPS